MRLGIRRATTMAMALCLGLAVVVSTVGSGTRPAFGASLGTWGPAVSDNFFGTTLNSRRWWVYNDPTGDPRRLASLTRVRNGELQLVGMAGREYGAGVGDRISYTYGRWTARFRVDAGAGYGTGILLWPASERWPNDGEIDLIEVPKADRRTGYSYVHVGGGEGGNDDVHVGRAVTPYANFTQWHTISVDWFPWGVVITLDGKQWSAPASVGGLSMIPQSPLHFALQMDACAMKYGNWIPCSPSPRQTILHIDWVQVRPFYPSS
jgi:licheninase